MERLIDGGRSGDLQRLASASTDPGLREAAAELRARGERVVPRARARVARLSAAIRECEQFEQSLFDCRSWTTHMRQILDARVYSDIAALDVPDEYKVYRSHTKEISYFIVRPSLYKSSLLSRSITWSNNISYQKIKCDSV
jgi:hypothetical protein